VSRTQESDASDLHMICVDIDTPGVALLQPHTLTRTSIYTLSAACSLRNLCEQPVSWAALTTAQTSKLSYIDFAVIRRTQPKLHLTNSSSQYCGCDPTIRSVFSRKMTACEAECLAEKEGGASRHP
jgi:hypothetical protein